MNPFIKAIQTQFPDGVRGTSRQLLEHLGKRPAGLEAKDWPGNAYWASRIIKTHKAQLEAAGWTIEIEPSTTKGKRAATWHLVPPAKEEPGESTPGFGTPKHFQEVGFPPEVAEVMAKLYQDGEENIEKAWGLFEKLVENVAALEVEQDKNFDATRDRDVALAEGIGALQGTVEAIDERISKLAALGERLFDWFERENKLRWERVEKLGSELEEAMEELDRLSRPWWKIGGKK